VESAWFDTVTSNDRRSWAGLAVSYRPDFAQSLELGAARAVYGSLPSGRSLAPRWLDVLRPVPDPALAAAFDSGGRADARDQVASLWARWSPTATGLEVYGEVGRAVLPVSWRDAFVDPFHSAAFVVGLQHVTPAATDGVWRWGLELATTEQSPSFRWRPLGSWGTSRVVPQGYTHLGRPLGLGLGPGSSGQWWHLDRLRADGSGYGVYVSRVRQYADAMLALPWNTAGGQGYCEFDTGLEGGGHVAVRSGPGVLTVRAGVVRRLNVFMQNRGGCGSNATSARDLTDLNLEVTWAPARTARVAARGLDAAPSAAGILPPLRSGRPDDARRRRDWALGASPAHPVLRSQVHDFVPTADPHGRLTVALADAGARWQSSRPVATGANGIWAGRGATAWAMPVAQLGGGRVQVVVAPLLTGTQDLPFALQDNGLTGTARFAHGQYPTAVDAPQRFQDGGVMRLSGGQSAVSISGLGLQLRATTATERWGPVEFFPYLRSGVAEGYPRVQVGTQPEGVSTWVGHVQWRVEWGILSASRVFSAVDSMSPARRFGTGGVIAITPRFAPRLTVGAARFFHIPFASGQFQRRWMGRVFEGILKRNLPVLPDGLPGDDRTRDGENQLASVFGRLGVGGGLEVYGEVGREDYSWDARDLLVAPLQQGGVVAGLARTVSVGRGSRTVRAEAMVFPGWSADRNRGVNGAFLSPSTYLHRAGAPQGHTHRGLVLGAPVGVGAASGQMLAFSEHGNRGDWEVQLSRVVRQTREFSVLPERVQDRALEVDWALQTERSLHRVPARIGASLTWTFNRALMGDGGNVSVWLRLDR
jgi:hypothetical protein